jgi:hypothetical protein
VPQGCREDVARSNAARDRRPGGHTDRVHRATGVVSGATQGRDPCEEAGEQRLVVEWPWLVPVCRQVPAAELPARGGAHLVSSSGDRGEPHRARAAGPHIPVPPQAGVPLCAA